MTRTLASIQKIKEILPIENADKIELVKFYDIGWQCICKKGEFKQDDLCVYVEIDSILPEKPEFEFLRERKFRIKTIKLRGVLSQGIVFPLDILPKHGKLKVGDDVTSSLGIKKYEIPEPDAFAKRTNNVRVPWYLKPFKKYILRYNWTRRVFGPMMGLRKTRTFPKFIPKTDEPRIQSHPGFLQHLDNNTFYITQKLDGSSETIYYNNGVFGICSRNMEVYHAKYRNKYFDINLYTKAVEKYDLQRKLQSYCKKNKRNIALQGELVGPTIQKNKLGLSEVDIFFFNIYDIDLGRYVDFQEFIDICQQLNIKTVPIIATNIQLKDATIDMLLEFARDTYPNGTPQEGIVIRPMKETYLDKLGRFSFKVINNDFLLKYGE